MNIKNKNKYFQAFLIAISIISLALGGLFYISSININAQTPFAIAKVLLKTSCYKERPQGEVGSKSNPVKLGDIAKYSLNGGTSALDLGLGYYLKVPNDVGFAVSFVNPADGKTEIASYDIPPKYRGTDIKVNGIGYSDKICPSLGNKPEWKTDNNSKLKYKKEAADRIMKLFSENNCTKKFSPPVTPGVGATGMAFTSPFGLRMHPVLGYARLHAGIDLADGGSGAPVKAACKGTVVFAGSVGGYGNRIEIKHKTGIITTYNHLSAINISMGQEVTTGQQIGNVGDTGLGSGPHLHFEYIDTSGVPQDPCLKLNCAIYPV